MDHTPVRWLGVHMKLMNGTVPVSATERGKMFNKLRENWKRSIGDPPIVHSPSRWEVSLTTTPCESPTSYGNRYYCFWVLSDLIKPPKLASHGGVYGPTVAEAGHNATQRAKEEAQRIERYESGTTRETVKF